MVNENFGTYRGLIRLALSYLQVGFKRAEISTFDPAQIKRLVFVCHGNICRSAFADHYAKQLGMSAASFGLSTTSHKGAHAFASEISETLGVSLTTHQTTAVQDFVPQAGDLLLAMEVRHLHKIAKNPALRDYPRTLLGLYTNPRLPHLHDPYHLDPRYMTVCLMRIRGAVDRLKISFPGAATAK